MCASLSCMTPATIRMGMRQQQNDGAQSSRCVPCCICAHVEPNVPARMLLPAYQWSVNACNFVMLQVETIMVSIISMLSSPNDESPANIDAAKEWREDKEGFRKHVGRCVRKSQEML